MHGSEAQYVWSARAGDARAAEVAAGPENLWGADLIALALGNVAGAEEIAAAVLNELLTPGTRLDALGPEELAVTLLDLTEVLLRRMGLTSPDVAVMALHGESYTLVRVGNVRAWEVRSDWAVSVRDGAADAVPNEGDEGAPALLSGEVGEGQDLVLATGVGASHVRADEVVAAVRADPRTATSRLVTLAASRGAAPAVSFVVLSRVSSLRARPRRRLALVALAALAVAIGLVASSTRRIPPRAALQRPAQRPGGPGIRARRHRDVHAASRSRRSGADVLAGRRLNRRGAGRLRCGPGARPLRGARVGSQRRRGGRVHHRGASSGDSGPRHARPAGALLRGRPVRRHRRKRHGVLPVGQHTVTAQKAGHRDAAISVVLKAGERRSVALTPAAIPTIAVSRRSVRGGGRIAVSASGLSPGGEVTFYLKTAASRAHAGRDRAGQCRGRRLGGVVHAPPCSGMVRRVGRGPRRRSCDLVRLGARPLGPAHDEDQP